MNLNALRVLIEKLRKEAIGEPQWVVEKEAFEYLEHSVKVVAVLKLIRAAHGIATINLLLQNGLFIDFGAIIRCVEDCTDEIYFLLEKFPNTSSNVDKFVESFFNNTIDGYLTNETPAVPSQKIRAAMVRVFKGHNDDAMLKISEKICKTFCGYVHANYAHIMEVYNGGTRDFNLAGVPSVQERQRRFAQVELAANSVLYAAAFIARTLEIENMYDEITRALETGIKGWPD